MSSTYLIDLPDIQIIFGSNSASLFETFSEENTFDTWIGYQGLESPWATWTLEAAKEDPKLIQYWVGTINHPDNKPVCFINFLHLSDDEDTNTLINIALEDMQDFLYKFDDWTEDQVDRLNYILLEPLYLGIKGALNIT